MAIELLPVPTWRALDDAAQQVGVSRRTLTRWISEGKLTAYRIAGDRRRYVDMDDIKRLREPEPLLPKEG
jgi:excisionase family DNA binding protein